MQDDHNTPDATPRPSTRSHAWRNALVVLGVVALLGVSLAFSPVRTFAAQVLSIFRVQKIATISVTSGDLEQMASAFEKGDSHISLKELGDVWTEGQAGFDGGAEPTLTTVAQAQSQVDFPLLVPTGIEGTQSVLLQGGGTVKFRLHVDKVNELLRYYGAEKFFSAGVDGKTFELELPPTVYIAYGDDKLGFMPGGEDLTEDTAPSAVTPDPSSSSVFIAQTRGPKMTVPSGVNPLEIRDVLLGLPFLPADIRSQLSGVQDWQSTLLIPNLQGSTKEITVNGNPGVVISEPQDPDIPPNERDTFAAVMWHQDGVLRAVASDSEAKSLKIAESLAR